MRGDRMYQLTNNYLHRFSEQCTSLVCRDLSARHQHRSQLPVTLLACLLLLTLTTSALAQEKPLESLKRIGINSAGPQRPAANTGESLETLYHLQMLCRFSEAEPTGGGSLRYRYC